MQIIRFWIAASAVALILVPTQLFGQDLEVACGALARGPIGSWAQQKVEAPAGTVDMKFALIASRGATWYEITAVTPQGTSIIQLEVPGFPFLPEEIQSAVMKNGATPAVVIPDAILQQYQSTTQSGPLADLESQCRTAEVIGSEAISVAAGSFETTHIRFPNNGGDVWVSADVPYGIVRGLIQGQGTLELVSFGSDATGSISETPVVVPGG